MDSVGEVYNGGTGRQTFYISLGGKHKDIVHSQVGFDVFYNIFRAFRFLLVFNNLPDPGKAFLQPVLALNPRLVFPMGRNAELGGVVHIPGADLDFKGDSFLINNRCVKGLVHVGLRSGNIVLEPVGDGLEQIVDNAQDIVAFNDGVDDDPHCVNIVKLFKAFAHHVNLAVNPVDAFHPALNMGFHTEILKPAGDPRLDFLNKLLPVRLF